LWYHATLPIDPRVVKSVAKPALRVRVVTTVIDTLILSSYLLLYFFLAMTFWSTQIQI
jgi:hypothetical protein